jgi:glycerophosphoryl diester phosphodiesterase
MKSFDLARAEGADGIELDVRLAACGEAIVLHDPDVRRVTSGADERRAMDLPYAELSRIDVGDGEHIPRLSSVLAWARGHRLKVNVELKHDVPDRLAVARAAARAIALVPDAPRFILVSSFDPTTLTVFRALSPVIPAAFLFHRGQAKYRPWLVARALPVHAAHPERTLVTRDAVIAAHRAGRLVNVWTVNDEVEARDLAELGVDGLISDRPAAIGAAVRRS